MLPSFCGMTGMDICCFHIYPKRIMRFVHIDVYIQADISISICVYIYIYVTFQSTWLYTYMRICLFACDSIFVFRFLENSYIIFPYLCL